MRKIQLLFLLASLLFATGCPKPRYRPPVNFDQGMVDKFNAQLKRQYREYECYRFGPTHLDFQGATCAGYVQNLDNAQGVRNELIENALSYIDENYNSFAADIQSGRDRNNFVLDVIDLSTAAAVGITRGERTLQIIGVALTAFRGGRKSADANFYKDTSVPILITKMDGNRARVRALIVEREGKPAADYTLGAAVSDIVDYYNAGTLVRAFTQLQQDAAVATKDAEKDLVDAKRKAGIKGAPSKEELQASNEFSGAITALVTTANTGTTDIATAQRKITDAERTIATATADISTADQNIGTAAQRITNAANPTALAQAQKAKAEAEAAKAQLDKKKLQAENERKTAETTITTAGEARDKALEKLKGIFDAIAADPKLSPLLSKSIEDDTNLDPGFKTTLKTALQTLLQKPVPTTNDEKKALINQYRMVLLQFQGRIAEAITTDPTLAVRLREILSANK